MPEDMYLTVKKWLEEKLEGSEEAVDNEWTVETAEDNDKFMLIDSPKMPFKVIVSVEDDITYVAFVTGLKLQNMQPDVVAPIYRDLLIQNNTMQLSKFCLMGEDDTLCLRVDLYTHYMDKKEFNMALEAVIMGGRWLIAQLGQTEDENIMAKEMASLGSAELLKGTTKEEVVAKMVKAGYPEDKAKSLVNHLAVSLGLSAPEDPKAAKAPAVTAKRDNPVDRYIW